MTITDKQREQLCWIVSIVLICSSPLLSQLAFNHYSQFRFNPFYLLVYPLVMAGILAFELLLSLGSPHRKFWVKEPSSTVEQRIANSQTWTTQLMERLSQADFQVEQTGPDQWEISKAQASAVHAYQDHGFEGKISILTSSIVTAQVSLTMKDTLILDSGELDNLNHFAHYLAGSSSPRSTTNFPFTLYTAVVLSVLSHGLGYLEHLAQLSFRLPTYELGFLGAGSAIWMAAIIWQKRKELTGLRVAIATGVAGAIPFCALLFNSVVQLAFS